MYVRSHVKFVHFGNGLNFGPEMINNIVKCVERDPFAVREVG